MASRQRISTNGTKILSGVILALGILIIVRTLAAGGGPVSVGVLLGFVFTALGGARLYLANRNSA